MWSFQPLGWELWRSTFEGLLSLHPRSDSLSQTSQQIRGKCLNSGWCQWSWSWRLPVVCCSTKNILNFIQMLFDVDVWKCDSCQPRVHRLPGNCWTSRRQQTSHLHSSPEWPRRKGVDSQLRTPSAQTRIHGSQRKNATSAFCWEGWRLWWKRPCRSPAVCTLCPRGSGPRPWTLRSPVWFRSRCWWEASQHRQRSPLWLWARRRPNSHLNHLLETDASKWGGAKMTNATRKKGR